MSKVLPASSSVTRTFNKVVGSNFLDKHLYKPAKENPAAFASKMALVSVLTKDVIGCWFYVRQSLKNKEMPEERRNFVASLDLMNGILNLGLQFTVGTFIDKFASRQFDNYIDDKLSVNKTRALAKKTFEKIKADKPEESISFDLIENYLHKNKSLGKNGKIAKWLKIGFSTATMLVATQVVTKRMFVPLLATPMAGWFKDNVMKKKGAKPEEVMTPAMINSTMPKVASK